MAGYLTADRTAEILDRMDGARVALIGDLCLDLYWKADMRLSELSRETPHHPLPVVSERWSPGGAGNAACNLAALRPGRLTLLGVVGEDWRGGLLIGALEAAGIDCGRVVKSGQVVTNAYIKPLRAGISDVVYEDPRIDFENRAPLPAAIEGRLIEALDAAEKDFDVLLVSDQLEYGCVTGAVRRRVCEMGRAGKRVIVDSRSRIGLYRDVIVKPNEVEASRAYGDGSAVADPAAMARLAMAASGRTGRVAVVTGGPLGCFVADGGKVARVPAPPTNGPIDTVGAGDTFLAALGAALAAGSDLREGAALANLASAVTIRKVGTTGTASRAEVLARAREAQGTGDD